MYNFSAIKFASLKFCLIACSFMEVLEPELLDSPDTDDLLLFWALWQFSWTIFFVVLDVIMDQVFECICILINLVKPVATLYLLRVFKFTAVMSI